MVLRFGIRAFRKEVVVVPLVKLALPRATVVFSLLMVESPMEVVVTPLETEVLPIATVVLPLAMEVFPTARAVLPSVMLVFPMEQEAVSPSLCLDSLLAYTQQAQHSLLRLALSGMCSEILRSSIKLNQWPQLSQIDQTTVYREGGGVVFGHTLMPAGSLQGSDQGTDRTWEPILNKGCHADNRVICHWLGQGG